MNSQSSKVVSIMEQKAKAFPLLSPKTAFQVLQKDKEETKGEILQLRSLLQILSRELEEARSALSLKEKQFTLLANYKHLLERTLTPITICPPQSPRKRKPSLLEQLEALTPGQLQNLEDIEL